jgi:hypothetical protein
LGEYAAWDPGGTHSSNSLFAAAMLQGGSALQIPPADLYYALLPVSHVKIHGRRGMKVRGLWYDGPALDPYRNEPSARGGQHRGRWLVHYDRRDARQVVFQDPRDQHWHQLSWVGLPPDGDIPAFGDASREQLLRTVRQAGLAPQSDQELLPVLLDLLADTSLVDSWPGQDPRRRRRQAREVTAAHTAGTDRRGEAADQNPIDTGVLVEAPGWERRTRHASEAVDARRRRRRERDVPNIPAPPPRLGEGARRRSLLRLSDEVVNDGGTAEEVP